MTRAPRAGLFRTAIRAAIGIAIAIPVGTTIGIAIGIAAFPAIVRADEGMWLLNHPPSKLLEERYGFRLPDGFVEHAEHASVLFDGSSGSLVSSEGLVMTNHHVGLDWIQELSTVERNLVRDGFYAATREEELRCPGLEVKVLQTIEEVTDRVQAAVRPGMPAAEAWQARRAAMTRIEQEKGKATGLDCEVVTLYQGARFDLYSYKRYDDVRLVMTPEIVAPNFGGDADNFEYPRYAFDVCFFRIYEDGRPLKSPDHLRFGATGVAEGDLVMAFGHPYRTNRLYTVAQLRFERDVRLPGVLALTRRTESELLSFSVRSKENARVANTDLLNVQNGRKADVGSLAALLDPQIFQAKESDEAGFRTWVEADPQRAADWGDAWRRSEAAVEENRRISLRQSTIGSAPRVLHTDLFRYALTLVELASELPKPSTARLREYRDSELASVYLELYSPKPISEEYEIAGLTSGLTFYCETFGAEDSLVSLALAGKSPADRAAELVHGSSLKDPVVRESLVREGPNAIRVSRDPMIRFAAILAPAMRALRLAYEERVESEEEAAHMQLEAARFARFGENVPPDATGTLRLSFGQVRGYKEGEQAIPAFTDFDGLYRRWEEHQGEESFELSNRWLSKRNELPGATPFNFVTTLDIVGGNSGSPVLDRSGNLVGIVFDGNLESFLWDYAYEETRARCIVLDARAIRSALDVVYEAHALVRELEE